MRLLATVARVTALTAALVAAPAVASAQRGPSTSAPRLAPSPWPPSAPALSATDRSVRLAPWDRPSRDTPAARCAAAASLYDRALAALVRGYGDDAEDLLDLFVRACPTHPAARELLARLQRVNDVLEMHASSSPPPRRVSPSATASAVPAREDAPSGLALAELLSAQVVLGGAYVAGIGLLTAGLASNGRVSAPGILTSAAFGLGAGGLFALAASRGRVTPRQVAAYNLASLWGAFEGLATGLAVGDSTGRPASGMPAGSALFLAGSLAGAGLGALLVSRGGIAPGYAAVIHSGGLWGGALGAMASVMAFAGRPWDLAGFAGIELATVNLGLIAGAVAGRFVHATRLQMLVVDAGAATGLALGVGMGALGAGAPLGQTWMGLGGALGLGFGYIAGAALAHTFRTALGAASANAAPPRVTLAPIALEGGAMGLGAGAVM